MLHPTPRLETIRATHRRFGTEDDNVGYLLKIIDLLGQIIEAAQISGLDPDNQEPDQDTEDCPCQLTYQDDNGQYSEVRYNPRCPAHGDTAEFSYSCTFYAHRFCDGTTTEGQCTCTCHHQEQEDRAA